MLSYFIPNMGVIPLWFIDSNFLNRFSFISVAAEAIDFDFGRQRRFA